MKITILGTGHGTATECYNTCFTISDDKDYFLIDSGGGNGILKQLKDAKINVEDLTNVFISHKHSDHILGAFWLIRIISRKYIVDGYEKEHFIYGNDEVINALRDITKILLPEKFIKFMDTKIKLVKVKDGDSIKVLNHKCTFFDILSNDVKQFGFFMDIGNNKKFTFIGDESCQENTKQYVRNSEWLFADAYKSVLMEHEKDKKYRHSTVESVSRLCQELNVKNVILSHTLDDDLKKRKENYTQVAKKFFNGNVFVPNDLEIINI